MIRYLIVLACFAMMPAMADAGPIRNWHQARANGERPVLRAVVSVPKRVIKWRRDVRQARRERIRSRRAGRGWRVGGGC